MSVFLPRSLGASHPRYELFLDISKAIGRATDNVCHAGSLFEAWQRLRYKAHGPWQLTKPAKLDLPSYRIGCEHEAANAIRTMSPTEVLPEGRTWWNTVAAWLDGDHVGTKTPKPKAPALKRQKSRPHALRCRLLLS